MRRARSGAAEHRYLEAEYRYLEVEGFHVRATIAPLRLARRLWAQDGHFLGDEGRPARRGVLRFAPRELRRLLRTGRRFGRCLIAFARSRWQSEAGLALPVDGDFAMVRRSGVTVVLDLDRNLIHIVALEPAAVARLRHRLEATRRVEAFDFAPRTVESAPEKGHYSVAYVPGRHPHGYRGCRRDFRTLYLPLLTEFARAWEPRWEPVGAYASTLRREIVDGAQRPGGVAEQLGAEAWARLERFVDAHHASLADLDAPVARTLSHGDFFSGNVLVGERGHLAVDWAELGERTPTHDLYYLFLNHCVRALEPAEQASRLRGAADELRRELARVDPERFEALEPVLRVDRVTRRLFYLECVHAMVQPHREPGRCARELERRRGWFEAFERLVALDGAPMSTA